jgi:hypothetical protein
VCSKKLFVFYFLQKYEIQTVENRSIDLFGVATEASIKVDIVRLVNITILNNINSVLKVSNDIDFDKDIK